MSEEITDAEMIAQARRTLFDAMTRGSEAAARFVPQHLQGKPRGAHTFAAAPESAAPSSAAAPSPAPLRIWCADGVRWRPP
ncbi:MAG: hypothetical protein KIT25_04110 [Enhydrobacter sp.]|nr:MAG: hypothetical protein KIT25_04110 [Enhydrobacter sp.]